MGNCPRNYNAWRAKHNRAVVLHRDGVFVRCWHPGPVFGCRRTSEECVPLALTFARETELREARERNEVLALRDFAEGIVSDGVLPRAALEQREDAT